MQARKDDVRCHLDTIRELNAFSKCRIGLNLSKTFCITFAYFIYPNHQPEKSFDSLSASILNLKMTSRSHWNVVLSCLRCFLLVCVLINITLIFKQIWTKRTTRKLASSHSGIQIQVRNQSIYQSSTPLDNKILYKLINVKQFAWSYDCPYRLPPLFLFIFTAAVSWNMESIHMKENCNNLL